MIYTVPNVSDLFIIMNNFLHTYKKTFAEKKVLSLILKENV